MAQMIRTNQHIAKKQLDEMQRISDRLGLSRAELIRRAIDEYLARQQPVSLQVDFQTALE